MSVYINRASNKFERIKTKNISLFKLCFPQESPTFTSLETGNKEGDKKLKDQVRLPVSNFVSLILFFLLSLYYSHAIYYNLPLS